MIVDGIPRDEFNVVPFRNRRHTVLKSAAAVALYGSLAAKGVVSITTKRGLSKVSKFDVRINTVIWILNVMQKYLSSSEYMTLYNEAPCE